MRATVVVVSDPAAEQSLSQAVAYLSQAVSYLHSIHQAMVAGVYWVQTPAGSFGVLARVTFGEVVLACLVVAGIGLKLASVVVGSLDRGGFF